MKKYIFITLVLFSFSSCSQKTPTAKVSVKESSDKNITKEIVVNEPQNIVSTDFIPEHIRRSRIEVVKHY